MARLRQAVAATVHGVPLELTDPAADCWHDRRAFIALADRLNLKVGEPPEGPAAPCGKRRAALVHAWALENGFTSSAWLGTLDHERLREHGVDGLRNWPTCPHEGP